MIPTNAAGIIEVTPTAARHDLVIFGFFHGVLFSGQGSNTLQSS
jgi:hypothetical protein